ncbi:MAG: M20/M25/M40 family metallo-hydrolase [Caldilineaceae bacterium]
MKYQPQRAIDLLQGLVAIRSLSTQEAEASAWLVEQMKSLGYDQAYVDGAGSAVGEIGSPDATHTLLLLGHIDTVPGNIPVRIEESEKGANLYGRGSVDAKGPLATFTMAAAEVGSQWAREHDLRIVVVGAVEEEYATSKGARFIRDRFNGIHETQPIACIIGEPSAWSRVTLGYKGRLLIELDASQPMAHTAGPDIGVATIAVNFWNWLSDYAIHFNQDRGDKNFEQFQPSLRKLLTFTDEKMYDHVQAQAGIRLPLDFPIERFVQNLAEWSITNYELGITNYEAPQISPEYETHLDLPGDPLTIHFVFRSYEPAWRGDRNNFLVRSFLAAIRDNFPEVRPSLLTKTGTSDMNVVGPAWNCSIVAYGPGDSSLDHTPNEHISLDEYQRAIQVLTAAIHNIGEQIAA